MLMTQLSAEISAAQGQRHETGLHGTASPSTCTGEQRSTAGTWEHSRLDAATSSNSLAYIKVYGEARCHTLLTSTDPFPSATFALLPSAHRYPLRTAIIGNLQVRPYLHIKHPEANIVHCIVVILVFDHTSVAREGEVKPTSGCITVFTTHGYSPISKRRTDLYTSA